MSFREGRRLRTVTCSRLATAVAIGLSLAGMLSAGAAGAMPLPRHGPMGTGLAWHQILPATAPSPRDRAGIAYDPADRYTVLYGGYDAYTSPALYNDTWRYAGGNWTQLHPALHPSAPSGLVLAYDPALKGVIAFGGEAPYGASFYNDTWLFHAGNWSKIVTTSAPPGRSQYAMAFDAADHEIVLFGGTDGGSTELSDTWTFNGTGWSFVPAAHGPHGREFASMVYDHATGGVLLFGGTNQTSRSTAGTWEFRAGNWTFVRDSDLPGRTFTPATTLPGGTPVFFGGLAPYHSTFLDRTFTFRQGGWDPVHAAGPPPARAICGMTYDALDGYDLLFGGARSGGYYNDTWALS